jgi:hypothetical protein
MHQTLDGEKCRLNEREFFQDDLGLHWDRDTLAFYGDPAWEAKLAPIAWCSRRRK